MAEITKAKKMNEAGFNWFPSKIKRCCILPRLCKTGKAKEQGAKDLKKQKKRDLSRLMVVVSKKKKAGEKLAIERKAEKAKSEKNGYAKSHFENILQVYRKKVEMLRRLKKPALNL